MQGEILQTVPEWIECLDGSHISKDKIVSIRINARDIEDTFVVVAEVDIPNRNARRELFIGDQAECESYRDEFIGKSQSSEDAAGGTSKIQKGGSRTAKKETDET